MIVRNGNDTVTLLTFALHVKVILMLKTTKHDNTTEEEGVVSELLTDCLRLVSVACCSSLVSSYGDNTVVTYKGSKVLSEGVKLIEGSVFRLIVEYELAVCSLLDVRIGVLVVTTVELSLNNGDRGGIKHTGCGKT